MCRPDCPVSLGVSVATVTIPERYNASLLLDLNLEAGRQDRTAILCEDESLTYGELFARACGAGAALRDLGVQPGERVLLVMDDCPSFPAAFLGALRIGVVPVPVNPLYGPDDYAYFVEDSGARLAIVDAACAEKVRAPNSLLVDELGSSEELLRPTRSATTWRSGCTAPVQQVARRESSTCTAISSTRARRTLDTSSGSPKPTSPSRRRSSSTRTA